MVSAASLTAASGDPRWLANVAICDITLFAGAMLPAITLVGTTAVLAAPELFGAALLDARGWIVHVLDLSTCAARSKATHTELTTCRQQNFKPQCTDCWCTAGTASKAMQRNTLVAAKH